MKYKSHFECRAALYKHGYSSALVGKIMMMDSEAADFYTRLLTRAPEHIVRKINVDVTVLDRALEGSD